jgi:hypothetical protein
LPQEAQGRRIGGSDAPEPQIGFCQRSCRRFGPVPDRQGRRAFFLRIIALGSRTSGWQRDGRHLAPAQHSRRLGQRHGIGPLHQVQHVAGSPAAEAMEPPGARAVPVEGEAGGAVCMERTAGLVFAASRAKGHQLAGNLRHRIVAPNGVQIDHRAPPSKAKAASIAAQSGRTAWARQRNCAR